MKNYIEFFFGIKDSLMFKTQKSHFLITAILIFSIVSLLLKDAEMTGDAEEYVLTTVAIANHGTPDIRLEDIQIARKLMPERYNPGLDVLADGVRRAQEVPKPGFHIGEDGRTYAIHFFVYSALAVIPFKILSFIELSPLKSFQITNLAMLLVVSASVFRWFASGHRTFLAVVLFMMCGGFLYWNWTGPEIVTAAAIFSGLILFGTGAPLAGAMLGGLAASHNPSAVFFFVFAPLISLLINYHNSDGILTCALKELKTRKVLAIGLGIALSSTPVLFNYTVFGVPSLIAVLATDIKLISFDRLISFFFDINQGMIIGIPGLLLGLVLYFLYQNNDLKKKQGNLQIIAVLVSCLAMMLAFAIPALAAGNWNSGANGVMRYAYWASSPLLFFLIWLIRVRPEFPNIIIVLILVVQSIAMLSANSYNILKFSIPARLVMKYAPAWYNPEPEIFIERTQQREIPIDVQKIYMHGDLSNPRKILFNLRNLNVATQLCGENRELSNLNNYTRGSNSWVYLNGNINCKKIGTQIFPPTKAYGVEEFEEGNQFQLISGWSKLEYGTPEWTGVWSVGDKSTLRILLSPSFKPDHLSIDAQYLKSQFIQVKINGLDYGWLNLSETLIEFKKPVDNEIFIELTYDDATTPPTDPSDTRRLAIFLNKAVLTRSLIADH